MTFGSNNPFSPPAYSTTTQPLTYSHDIKQPVSSHTHLSPYPDHEYSETMRAQSPIPHGTPRRLSNESSPAQSLYSDNATLVDTPTNSAIKVLDCYHTKSHINIRVYDKTNPNDCLYYVDNSAFTPSRPDVLIFAGPDKQGYPIIAAAKWSSMYSKHTSVAIGDTGLKGENPNVSWLTVSSTSTWKQNEHHWRLPSDPKAREYAWKRTHHEGLDNTHDGGNKLSGCSFKLVDVASGEVLATFASNRFKSWKKLGKFTFRADLGEEWTMMCLVTCFALVEKSRRRSRARRSNPGAYGGG
ncbi:uncharacterized protein AB675_4055 [Cyphellophora attinorum]|uniref:Uncharacterized protein n=1 Tax=Cyphellophora attinorum TaxID=1664694 RepID=A0A0N1H2Q5_9EURO|nr:uncharacterized protein AB675_4055 [Phialophora attinorum]KPI34462.1 hypothetical protein AB675_4055 [Phialophora attinorum]